MVEWSGIGETCDISLPICEYPLSSVVTNITDVAYDPYSQAY